MARHPPTPLRTLLTRAIALALVLAGCVGVQMELPPPPISQPATPTRDYPGPWQTFGVHDGLPHANITGIAVTPDGVVWVGTGRGAAAYDGRSWTAYQAGDTLLSDLVLDIAVAHNGVLWFGTDKGLSRYDGRSWVHFTEQDGIPAGYVQTVAAGRDGVIWLGLAGVGADWAFGNGVAALDNNGTPRKDDDGLVAYPPTVVRMAGSLASAIADFGELGVWFGVTPEGTVRPAGGQGGLWRLARAGTGSADSVEWSAISLPTGDAVNALLRAADGRIWIGTPAGIVVGQAEEAGPFVVTRQLGVEEGLPSEHVLALAAGSDGRVWIGTDAGLALYAGGTVTTITIAQGLASNYIRAIALAPDGAVWVATPAGASVCCRS